MIVQSKTEAQASVFFTMIIYFKQFIFHMNRLSSMESKIPLKNNHQKFEMKIYYSLNFSYIYQMDYF